MAVQLNATSSGAKLRSRVYGYCDGFDSGLHIDGYYQQPGIHQVSRHVPVSWGVGANRYGLRYGYGGDICGDAERRADVYDQQLAADAIRPGGCTLRLLYTGHSRGGAA